MNIVDILENKLKAGGELTEQEINLLVSSVKLAEAEIAWWDESDSPEIAGAKANIALEVYRQARKAFLGESIGEHRNEVT